MTRYELEDIIRRQQEEIQSLQNQLEVPKKESLIQLICATPEFEDAVLDLVKKELDEQRRNERNSDW